MPRPQKKRRVCREPEARCFGPERGRARGEILLTVDEYEAIRLIDLEHDTQEECAEQMGVSSTTVQGVYDSARRKLADALVNGKRLTIAGGDYVLCDECSGGCRRAKRGLCPRWMEINFIKSEDTMRIAVTYQDGQVFPHFGHTETFEIYDTADGKITQKTLIDTNGSGHGALAELLKKHEVDTLICGGIGAGARQALDAAGIALYGGVTGSTEAAVLALLGGNLVFNPDVKCDHHGHGHGHDHGHEHKCGGHGHEEGHGCGGHDGCSGNHCGGHSQD